MIYRTEREKFEAVVKEIKQCNEKGQPVLVGTISIDRSEKLSSMLKRAGVKHVVLNAKYHEKEAEIVAQAGRKGAVTIATNMAGRGTDILLGGNPDFLARDVLRKRDIDPAQATPEQWREAVAQVKPRHRQGTRRSRRGRRPAHHRHRTSRSAAHRQPASRTFRTPGRSRVVAILRFARRRPDAHLRSGPHFRNHAAARHGRRRADRIAAGLQADRKRAEAR